MRAQRTPLFSWPLGLALLLLQPVAAWAAPAGKSLAVLEFKSKLPKADADVGYLTDVVRTAAKDALPSLKVMTRENLLVLLAASGKKAEECEGECEVDTGRRVGADLVISGEVLKFGTKLKINMKMHDTHDGALLSGAQVSGKDLDELDKNLGPAVLHLLEPLGARREEFAPPPPGISSRGEPQPRPETQQAEPAPQPEPELQTQASGSKVGFGLYLLGGALVWTNKVPSLTLDASYSGTTYGLAGHFVYRLTPKFGLGLLAQVSSLTLEDPKTQQTDSATSITLGAIGSYKLERFELWAALGVNGMSNGWSAGGALSLGLDWPVWGAFAIRGQLDVRTASRSDWYYVDSLNQLNGPYDESATSAALELGLGAKF